ncbi:MAG: hypothetical protein MMC23_007336 [Stictis urceolatum]|nr:hypothetical protein [Stictis urceolata]
MVFTNPATDALGEVPLKKDSSAAGAATTQTLDSEALDVLATAPPTKADSAGRDFVMVGDSYEVLRVKKNGATSEVTTLDGASSGYLWAYFRHARRTSKDESIHPDF